MYAYCLNNPVRHTDDTGYATRDKVTCPILVVVIMDGGSGSGGGNGDSGGGISPIAILITLIAELFNRQSFSGNETEDDMPDAVFYGIDFFRGRWNILTEPMNFQEAANWAIQTALSKKYNDRASWGLYTPNKTDAEAMAVYLGLSFEYTHDPAEKGHKAHYHTAGRLIYGVAAQSFHVWYEE